MKVINFKNSEYYKLLKENYDTNFVEEIANIIEKNLSEKITFKLQKDSEENIVFSLVTQNRMMFPDYMQTYEIEATSGFLVSEARKSKETAEKIVLEAFASMYQEMAAKRLTSIERKLTKEDVVKIGEFLKKHPEQNFSNFPLVEFVDPALEQLEQVEMIEKFPIKLDFKATRNYQTLSPLMQKSLSEHLDKLFASVKFGAYLPPADDMHYVLTGFKANYNDEATKTMVFETIEESIQAKLLQEIPTKEKMLLCAFSSLVENCITNNKSYADKRMTHYEMSVICNPTDTKTSNTNRDGKDDK